jgi:indolepyruvate ferredoxin oxidoreductase
VLQALEDLGIDESHAAEIGIRLYKVGMPWPLEPNGVREFAQGLEEVLVVEEKRQVIEYQMKEQLYNWRDDVRPRVVGKYDEHGEWEVHRSDWLLPAAGELTPAMIARVIARRIAKFYTSKIVEARLKFIEAEGSRARAPARQGSRASRTSARAARTTPRRACPKARRRSPASAATTWRSGSARETMTFTQMGGEGAAVDRHRAVHRDEARVREPRRRHLLPLGPARDPRGGGRERQHHLQDPLQRRGRDDRRAAVDGQLTVPMITRQVLAEGVKKVGRRHRRAGQVRGADLAPGTWSITATTSTRCSASCARSRAPRCWCTTRPAPAEKRRRRKRGTFPDPQKRVVINELVCEGCGDCSVKSNCLSVVPWRPSSAASAPSTRARATRTTRAPRASARASSPSRAGRCARRNPW